MLVRHYTAANFQKTA